MSARTRTRLGTLIRTAVLVCGVGATAACAGASAGQKEGELTPDERAAAEVAKKWLRGVDAPALQSVEAHTWPDSSLGCPQPGMSYMQVVTEGYIVRLEADGKVHEVHVAGANAVTCDRQVSGVLRRPGSPTRVTTLPAMEEAAIADLAQRLNASPDSIRVKQRTPRRFSDATLDCAGGSPQPPTAQAVQGFELRLEHAGRAYTYHTDLKRVIACPPIEAE